jgi:hypothetical protein
MDDKSSIHMGAVMGLLKLHSSSDPRRMGKARHIEVSILDKLKMGVASM